MIRIIELEQREEWDGIVQSFERFDVYYLSGYVHAFMLHGDGIPILVYVEKDATRAMSVYMKRDVADDKKLKGFECGKYFDLITPYGYGGLVFEGDVNERAVKNICEELAICYQSEHIIAEFVRWHPVLQNANLVRGIIDVIDLGSTIHMDTTSEEVIWQNITSKNRNTIRRAERNGITIEHSDDPELFHDFIKIYNQTMDRDHVEEYYYFEDAFYQSIAVELKGKYELFYAVHEDKIIAMSIILFVNRQVHYHLSGSLSEYRNLNPSNLLLYKVACWAAKQGYKTFHMGGGVGSGIDNLYKFKQSFNRNSCNQFSISKIIHNLEAYDEVLSYRKQNDKEFNKDSFFFPLYRS